MASRTPEPLASLLPALKVRLWAVMALNALTGALTIVLAGVLAGLLHRLIFEHTAPESGLWGLGLWGLGAGLIIARALATWGAGVVAADLGLAAQARLRHGLFAALTDFKASPVAPTVSAAEAAALATDGVELVTPFLSGYLPAVAQAGILTLAILAVVAPLDWISGVTLAVTAPLIPLFMILIGSGAERLNRTQWAVLTRLGGGFLDAVQALPLLRHFGATARETARIARAAETYRSATMTVLRVAFLSALALEILATLGVALVAVFLGFRLLWGMVDYERALFILLLAPEFYLPLRALGAQYHARMDALAAAERLAPLLRDRPLTPGPAPATPAAAPACPPLARTAPPRVTLDAVRFAYPAATPDTPPRPVLTDWSVTLEPGTLTALVGASGAGKSTLLGLLRGVLAPSEGHILLDGEPLDALRHRPAWVPQTPHLLGATIAEALRLGAPEASDDALWKALNRVGAEAMVAARPDGLATPLGEGGRGFSGGEVRRLALARALLADAPFVLMDEPSASLDHASEDALIRALEGLRAGRTLVIAAHRLSTLRAADRILVVDEGRLAADGSYAALAADATGPFARLMGSAPPLVAAALGRTAP